MTNKQQVFNNMFDSLKVGGKVAIQYMSYLPLFDYNAYVLLNPENAERIFRLFHLESKTKIERSVYRRDLMKSFGVLTPTARGLCLKPFRSFSNGNGRLHVACLILPLSLKSDWRSVWLPTLMKTESSLSTFEEQNMKWLLLAEWQPLRKTKNIHKENHTLLHRFSVYDSVMFLCGSPKLNSPLQYTNFCWTIVSLQHGLWLLVSGVKRFLNSVWPKHRFCLLVQWKTETLYPCALNAVIHWINVN